MPKLMVVSAIEIIKVAQKAGFEIVSQKGSHIKLKNSEGKILIIPNHKILKKGTTLQIIKTLGITKEELGKLL